MKYLILTITFLLISCGGGGNAGSSPQQTPQVETITFKNVPEDLSIFE